MQRLKTDVIYERYPALKFISGFYRVLAWICFVGSIITFIYLLTQGKLGIPLAIGTILIGGILFVTFLAIAEGIKLFMDIAQNTRITAINSKK